MDLIKTGIGLTKTIKNVARLREIISVFARNGFDEFIIKSGIHDKIPEFVLHKSRINEAIIENHEGNWASSIGYRLRKAFEELGPCFIKLGQLLSTREDMFDPGFIEEMKKLLDQVKGIPFDEARSAMEKSLGKPLNTVFSEIDPVSIGNASIAVVYKGKLVSGKDVVIKLQRPHIGKMVNTDISIILFLVERLEKASQEVRYLGISKLINDFANHLRIELDFNIESLNCQRLKANIEKLDEDKIFYLPEVYREFSRGDLIVMEFLDGIPFSQQQRILEFKEEVTKKLLQGVHVFIDSLLREGFFHADLHGGNFFLLKDGRIGVIDFGLMGTLEKRGRTNLIAILNFLVTHNYENLVYEFLDVAEYGEIPDINQLTRDVRECLGPFVGLTVQQTNFSLLMTTIIKTLGDHRIFLPREWFTVFRALMTLDGVGKSLGIDFDIFSIIEKDLQGSVGNLISKEEILSEGLWAARDIMTTVRLFPRHLKWFIRAFSRNNYAFEIIHKGHEKELQGLKNSILFLGFTLLAGIFVMAGVLLINRSDRVVFDSIGPLTWVFWGAAGLFLAKGFLLSRK